MRTSLRAVWSITRKDLSLAVRRPIVIVVTVLPPLILLLVLIMQSVSVGVDPVAVVNDSPGCAASRAMQQIAAGYDGFSTTVTGAPAASADFQNLRVSAVLTIPRGFCAAIADGRHTAIGFQIRNFNADSTNDLERGISDIELEFLATGTAGPDPVHVTVAETNVNGRDTGFVAFEIVGALMLMLFQAGLINAGLAAALEWGSRTIKELLLAPITSGGLVIGKVIAGTLIADVTGLVLTTAAVATGQFPAPTPGSAAEAAAVMTLLGFFGSSLGVALGARLRSVQRLNPVTVLISYYLFFVAGGIAAVAYLPGWLRDLARIMPSSYGIEALRNTLLYHHTTNLTPDLLAVTAAGLVMLAIAILTIRRSLAH